MLDSHFVSNVGIRLVQIELGLNGLIELGLFGVM